MRDGKYFGQRVVKVHPSPGFAGVILGETDDGTFTVVEVLVPVPAGVVFLPTDDIERYLVDGTRDNEAGPG